jgi:hypothetical protein
MATSLANVASLVIMPPLFSLLCQFLREDQSTLTGRIIDVSGVVT